ncbi:unnamed protein product [Protopolystoma xenopodis]|uniref:Uncharacterized protein n=1 Tax=Protopolystoma xenopodis TaxID=117903 RepID=A0A448XBP6_9PLAT|nr:unnamed protein product [Protopolystoma xenopodis]
MVRPGFRCGGVGHMTGTWSFKVHSSTQPPRYRNAHNLPHSAKRRENKVDFVHAAACAISAIKERTQIGRLPKVNSEGQNEPHF